MANLQLVRISTPIRNPECYTCQRFALPFFHARGLVENGLLRDADCGIIGLRACGIRTVLVGFGFWRSLPFRADQKSRSTKIWRPLFSSAVRSAINRDRLFPSRW